MCSKSIKYFIIAVFVACFGGNLFSQEDISIKIQDIIEEIVASMEESNEESGESDIDYTELYSTLETYYNDPLNLNTATKNELEDLFFLSDFQIYSLLNYRQKYGDYNSIYELQNVDGIDIETLKRLIYFVKVGPAGKLETLDFKKMFSYGKHIVLTRYEQHLQKQEGYKITDTSKSRYLGNPAKLYLKYNYSYKNKFSIGFTAEKDPGEQFFKGAQKYGFDFYSAHIQLNDIISKNKFSFKKLILGDFSAQFGQGLTLWSGMAFGKTTSGVTNVIKKPRGVNKYTSVNEDKFFRGEAVTLQFGQFQFTEFVSYKKIDGAIKTNQTTTTTADTTMVSDSTAVYVDFDNNEEFINSFYEGGYHRTPNEVAKRKTIGQLITGGNLTWTHKIVRLGLTGVYTQYSHNFVSTGRPYQHFDFSGKSNFNGGLDYLLTLKQVNIFGETSMSQNLGWATLNGATFDFVPEFKMSLVHRYFSPDYHAIYAAPFSEGNKEYNENGIFVGAEIYPIKKWKFDVYFDAYKFPWLKFTTSAPTKGFETGIQVNYYTRRDVDMYVKVKYEQKEKTISISDMKQNQQYSTSSYIYQINYIPSDQVKLKSRVAITNYNFNESSWGYAIIQTAQYKPKKLPLTFNLHLALFNTQYETRIYCYEPDVLYGFSVPAYNGNGERVAFVIKYQIIEKLNLWFRIANTFYNNKIVQGSGLTKYDGRNSTDIKLELKYSF